MAALALGGSGALLWRHGKIARERDVEDARMRADFADGDVHVVDGWMVSRYEVEALGLENAPLLTGAP